MLMQRSPRSPRAYSSSLHRQPALYSPLPIARGTQNSLHSRRALSLERSQLSSSIQSLLPGDCSAAVSSAMPRQLGRDSSVLRFQAVSSVPRQRPLTPMSSGAHPCSITRSLCSEARILCSPLPRRLTGMRKTRTEMTMMALPARRVTALLPSTPTVPTTFQGSLTSQFP